MAITPKPKRFDGAPNVSIEAIIAKGGSVAGDSALIDSGKQAKDFSESEAKDVASFTMRVPKDLLDDLDNQRKSRRVKVSRQQWILEAIEQRLKNEGATSIE